MDSLTQASTPDMTGYALVCCGLIVAVLLLALAFKRLVGDSVKSRAAKRSLHVVDVLPLGGKRQLAVVNCYDRTFVLGLGEKDVRMVAELEGAGLNEHAAPPLEEDLAVLPRPRAGNDFTQELARQDGARTVKERGREILEQLRKGVLG